jgi:hypothetical protein
MHDQRVDEGADVEVLGPGPEDLPSMAREITIAPWIRSDDAEPTEPTTSTDHVEPSTPERPAPDRRLPHPRRDLL